MTLIHVLFGILIIGNFILYRMITRMIKYQNFKSNVILRLTLKDEMDKLAKFERSDLDSSGIRDGIVKKISEAIDEEIDNEPIWNWTNLITAIRAEGFFQTELSEPFHRAFYPSEIIKRHEERNKEYIKNKK